MLWNSYQFFLACRLASRRSSEARATASLLRFTVLGIALSLAVMLLTVFVGRGFREQVHERIYLLTGHIILNEYAKSYTDETASLKVSSQLLAEIKQIEGVAHVREVVQ